MSLIFRLHIIISTTDQP